MTDDEKKEKAEEYSQRYQYWTTIAINQLGFSINFFLTLGIGFTSFLVTEKRSLPVIHFDFYEKIDLYILVYMISLILSIFSIICGSVSVICRLKDLRLTRHIIWARKHAIKELGRLLPNEFIDLNSYSIMSVFYKISFILYSDFKDFDLLKCKFKKLSEQSKILGFFTWQMHIKQIVLISISTLIYALTFIIRMVCQ